MVTPGMGKGPNIQRAIPDANQGSDISDMLTEATKQSVQSIQRQGDGDRNGDGGDIDSAEIASPLPEVSKKVFFVRHGTTGSAGLTAQGDSLSLSEEGIREMREAIRRLMSFGVTKDNIVIYYDGKTERIVQALRVFQEELGMSEEECISVCIDDPALRTTTKILGENGEFVHAPLDDLYVEVL